MERSIDGTEGSIPSARRPSRARRNSSPLIRDTDPLVNTKLHGFEVDFKWPEHRLVVEVDGPHHQRARVKRDDAARDGILRAAGYRVLRFTDEDVYDRTDAVIRRTVAAFGPQPRFSARGLVSGRRGR